MDIIDYDDLKWFCFFLSLVWFCLLLFMQGSRVIEFFGAWHWNFWTCVPQFLAKMGAMQLVSQVH
jgi:hypothetical protein